MSALTECYARPSTPFGQLGPFYDVLGHRGKDYSRGARQSIIAYDDMVIEATPPWSSGLGWTVGLRRLNLGGFAGYAHIYDLQGGVGARIPKGGVIGYVAGWGDRPGSLWDGPHIHTTESWISASNAAAGVRPLRDPGPAIAAATRSSTAGLGPVLITPEEENTMYPVRWNYQPGNAHLFLLGPGHVHHFSTWPAADYLKRVTTGRWVEASNDELTSLLLALDVPWYAVDQAMRGSAPGLGGKVWTRESEILWHMARQKPVDEATLRKTLDEVLASAATIKPVVGEQPA